MGHNASPMSLNNFRKSMGRSPQKVFPVHRWFRRESVSVAYQMGLFLVTGSEALVCCGLEGGSVANGVEF